MHLPKTISLWLLLLPLLVSCGGGSAGSGETDWQLFKQRFVKPDGRVVDTGNEGVSHTEGQGVTMLLAVQNNDRATFDAIWSWTSTTLQVRPDKLLAWRWVSGEGVADQNNATDGDLFVAWALLRANRKWSDPRYLASAKEIMVDILKMVVRMTSRGVVLLPGAVGFEKPQGLVVNLSYWIFPALDELARADPTGDWIALNRSGLALLTEARFGRWELPPDWMMMGDKLTPYAESRFGYAASRIPLYMLWGKVENDKLLQPFQTYWSQFTDASFMPSWTNLLDNSFDSQNASVGMRSIAQFALGGPSLTVDQLASLDKTQEYYSSILLLLTKMALAERSR